MKATGPRHCRGPLSNCTKDMKYVLIQLILCTALIASAQNGNTLYKTMLKALLSHSVPELTASEAAELHGKALFLDAREPREFEVSHIKGATHVGFSNFSLTTLTSTPKNRDIIVYCSVGYRSEKIAEKLLKAGYSNVSNLYGGIFAWKNQNYDVYNDSGITQQVHAYSDAWGFWLTNGIKVYK